MKNSSRHARVLVGLAALCSAGPLQAFPGVPARDNVLVIVADDMGVERTPAYGLDVVRVGPMPVIDELARRGVLFRQAYSNTVCSPSRSEMLTGRFGFRTGIGISVPFTSGTSSNGNFQLEAAEITLPEVLRASHQTAAIGKWHLAINAASGGDGFMHPVVFGFDEHRGPMKNLGGLQASPLVYYSFNKQVTTAAGTQTVAVEDYATTDQVNDALAVIDEAGDSPWFVWLAFNAPHSPFHVPPTDLISVDVDEDSPLSNKHIAAIEAMDTEIGRLLANIRPSVLQRTWVIFVADNGSYALTLQPLVVQAKGTVHEFGIHVPLIIAGPGIQAPGRRIDDLVVLTDVFATVCDMAGVTVPPSAARDSRSLMPYLVDINAPSQRRFSYSEKFKPNGLSTTLYAELQRTIRNDRYKLIKQAALPFIGFYDLHMDPLGLVNLHPGLTAQQQVEFDDLSAQLVELLQSN
jgi:arylsulfatase A-like enzyme